MDSPVALQEKINIDSLLKLSDGDRKFVEEILSLFIERTPRELEKAGKFLEENKPSQLAEVLHKLKSFTTPLGLVQLQSKISLLENVIKTHEIAGFQDELNALLCHVEGIVERAKSQLKEFKSD